MNILLLGYGKMGKTIEKAAIKRKHSVIHRITTANRNDFLSLNKGEVNVAFEFSNPESAFENIKICLEKGIPVVCGTTGWLDKKHEIEKLCKEKNGGFFYASNYSVGVNLFVHLNKVLAKIMNNFPSYDISMEEIHHTEKKDAPSGTAITLAEGILESVSRKTKWINEETSDSQSITITDKRIENVPGTHMVFYNSAVDIIEIRHTAHTRDGFAEGAVMAAEWLQGRSGLFGMDDMLNSTI